MVKKHPSLKKDLSKLVLDLSTNPKKGTSLGHNLYKIRLAVTSKGKGKSGGARIITFLVTADREVFLVYIYDKGQLDNINKSQLVELLKKAGLF